MRAGSSAEPHPEPEPLGAARWEMGAQAHRRALPAVQAALEGFLVAQAVPEPLRLRAAVLVEEAFMNAVMHALAEAADPRLQLRALLSPDALVLQFEDRGPPFDAAEGAARSAAADPAEGPLGGRGLLLMQRLAAHVERERIGGLNRLTLRLHRR